MVNGIRRRAAAAGVIAALSVLGIPTVTGSPAVAETISEAVEPGPVVPSTPVESDEAGSRLEISGALQVSGGVDANFAPEYLARISNTSGGSSTLCTGTLISREWIVTAAHCVDLAAVTTATLGQRDVDNASQGITRAITTKLVDSRWNAANNNGDCDSSICNYDVAIMQLDTPVPNDWDVAPIPPDSFSANAGVDDPLYQGYGLTEANPPVFATTLQSTQPGDFELQEPCFPNANIDTFWCFQKQASSRTEGGDSGGPWQLAADGNWMLFAIHSGIITSGSDTWSIGTATEDITWLRSATGIPSYAAGTLLEDSSSGATFQVQSNGFRQLVIPSAVSCLVAAGASVVSVARSTYTTVPLASGTVACGPDRTLFAVGASNEAIGSKVGAGAVTVLSIDPSGDATGTETIHQGSPSVPGGNENFDGFGHSTVWADVDGNGLADLIIGSPFEDIGSVSDAGAITVVYDAELGVGVAGSAGFHQGSPGVPGANESTDFWGYSLGAADIDGDGYDDIVVGAPGEDIGSKVDVGAITVLWGSAGGLTASGAQSFHQNTSGVPGGNENGDEFGFSIAAVGSGSGSGLFIAVGVPGEDIGSIEDAGAVTIFATGPGGLSPTSKLFYQGASASGIRPDMSGASEAGDLFGFSLAGHADGVLAVGIPYEDIGPDEDTGAVWLYHGYTGSPDGRSIHQDTKGVPGGNEDGDVWGYALSANVVGSTPALVVGAPGEAIGSIHATGAVTVLPNPRPGQTITGATFWHQGTPGVPGANEVGDNLGFGVDLAPSGAIFIATPGEDIGPDVDTGAGTVLFGTPFNPDADGIVGVHQGTAGVPGANEDNDFWGS